MGGQACVLYGAAEFSRDVDLVVQADSESSKRLNVAIAELRAEVIAVPEYSEALLLRGHAVHFRCQHPEAKGLRIDVMAKLRGVDDFEELWARRTTMELAGAGEIDLLSLPDLVLAKKTQRDKDWPMIRRLVDSHYFANREAPNPEQVAFWLRELRTPEFLIEVAQLHRDTAETEVAKRPLLAAAISPDSTTLASLLLDEERREREADVTYWKPLKEELAEMRRRRKGPG